MKSPSILLALAVCVSLFSFSRTAEASGSRGMVLTPKAVDGFDDLKASELVKRPLHYVGSTARWHVFMTVITSTGGGMPFDTLLTFKVPVATLGVQNGWQLRFSKKMIFPADCPAAAASGKPPKITLPAGTSARSRCGT